MASKKPTEPNSLFANIKIKQEPGTSSSTPSQVNNSVATGRLKSFSHSRDLNLITVKTEKSTRKTVGPNVANYQRKKKEDVVVKQEPTKVRKERKAPGERVRGRGKNQTVSLGVATEAPSLNESRRPSCRSGGGGGGGGDRESRSSIVKPTVDLKQTINKEADKEILDSLHRDNFIDDGDDGYAGDSPYTLPVLAKAEQLKSDPSLINKNTAIKKENEIDQKPEVLENGLVENTTLSAKKLIKKTPAEEETEVENLPAMNPASLFEKNEEQSNDYLLIELPDCMPGFQKDDDDDEKLNKDGKNSKKEGEKSSVGTDDYCKLNSLKEGLIGKIQIHKSGKAYLKLGNNILHIDIALKRCFRQDLIAAKLENNKNNLINLGPISNTLNCTPSWESMLANV